LPSRPDSAQAGLSSQKHCVIQISSLLVDDMKLDDTLDLTVEANGIEIGGCVFKLAVANNIVDIVDILPGELVDSCRWDMFDAHQITTNDEAAPREVWQITTLTQGVSGRKKPVCFGFDRPAVLARLVVSSAHRPSVADTTAEIFFYWESCRDNILSSREGASVLVSDTVLDVVPAIYTTERGTFPTRYGSPANCVSPRAKYPPRRLVDFRNGGVTFKFNGGPGASDSSVAKP
ncbi:MAG: hypothetical protein NTW07_00360, partial [candidate division Zixibacteria bacterium]|nr:hypothetical protein [candidate division Zixibacteria bacterium]